MWSMWDVATTAGEGYDARIGTARLAFVLLPQSWRVHREDVPACAEPFASLLSSSAFPPVPPVSLFGYTPS